jgi:succinoglycan biosynthesis protein ExoA
MQLRVSLLIAMRNEAGYIEKCVTSILAQDYSADQVEMWVMDGLSEDSSSQIVERLFQGRPNCHLLSNGRITQSAGWNLGIARATGDVVGIIGAHSELAPDYISTAVETLQRTGADLVGGLMRAEGKERIAQAISLATSSPFGVGGARFHYTSYEEEVDTVYMGLCWRELFGRIGGFDEEMIRNQDDELSYRLLQAGGRIVCNPAIQSTYYNRSTLGSLWRQYSQYGFWKVRVMQKHPRQMRSRQFVPPLFVAALLFFLLMSPFSITCGIFLAVILVVYLTVNLTASILAVRKSGRRLFPLLPLTFITLHLSYGLGFLGGLLRFGNRWSKSGHASNSAGTGVSDLEQT